MSLRLNLPFISKLSCTTCLLVAANLAVAQPYYDRAAHIGATLGISSPAFVTSERQCADLNARLDKKAQDIAVAHDLCLEAEKGSTTMVIPSLDSKSKCSVAACQGLHDGRYSFQKHAATERERCATQLNDYRKEQQSKQDAEKKQKLSEDLARSKYSSCPGEWKSYKAVCTGNYESELQKKTCIAELDRLRRECRQ